jgi:Mg-chelatase subunit ChlI
MPRYEHGTDLEQGLAVSRRQLVQDQAPRLVVESAEDTDHDLTIGKSALAYQARPHSELAEQILLASATLRTAGACERR